MNRLAPLIVRRTGPMAQRAPSFPVVRVRPSPASTLSGDLQLFASVWFGAVVFFLTFLS